MKKDADPSTIVDYWLNELKQARKREDQYRKMGREVLKIYHAEETKQVPFNVLFSNTETLLPALYSAQARPVIQRRFKDDDPIGKLAAEASRRMLEYHLDTNREDYETPHEAMQSIVLDALTPGRGMAVVKYEANFRPIPEPQPPTADDEPPEKEAEPAEEAYNESVCIESLVWDRVHIGYAKKWTKVPWIAYEYYLTKEEVVALLSGGAQDKKSLEQAKSMAKKIKYTGESERDDEETNGSEREKKGQRKTACLYQIWDKVGGKTIKYLAPSYKEGLLKEDEDPLGLTGFFNTPRPLTFVKKSSSLVPTAPYQYYKVQAEELNEITRRINRLTKACKARALYDAQFGNDLERLMANDDVTMIPISTAGSLASERGVEQAVWMFPVDVIAAVLQQMYQARESCKQVIYEITGISDILRGATQASETATAQKIKNSWGTLRLKVGQSEVARYVRDLLRMLLELAATKFSEETWASVTGLPFLLDAKLQQLQQQAQAIASMGQEIPAELQQQLAVPTWKQILEILRNDFQRAYRIDIETNSTVEPEAAEDQKAIMEMLGAMGQAMNGIAPLVANGSMPFEVAKNIMLIVARRFRYGDQIEDSINAMKPPPPPNDGAKEAEAKKKELDLQKKQMDGEIQMSSKKAQMDVEAKRMQAEMEFKQREMDLQLREMQLKVDQQKMQMQHEADQQAFEHTKQRATEEIGVKSKIADMENKRYKTENVVNQKADTALGQGVAAMKGIVQQIADLVTKQSQENQKILAELVAMQSRARVN